MGCEVIFKRDRPLELCRRAVGAVGAVCSIGHRAAAQDRGHESLGPFARALPPTDQWSLCHRKIHRPTEQILLGSLYGKCAKQRGWKRANSKLPGEPRSHTAMQGGEEAGRESRLLAQKNDDLIDAIAAGDMPVVKELLAVKAQVDVAANENGCRGLHLACHKGNRKMLQYLLTLKPDLEVTTHLLQLTPLHCAVNAKATACVKLLLESGADFEAQTDTGQRALHIAIQRMDLPTLKVLIDAGVDKYAPALSVWEGGVPRTPIELARLLPAPFSDSIEKLLRMTHKQRQVCVRCPPWVLICALAFLPACLFA